MSESLDHLSVVIPCYHQARFVRGLTLQLLTELSDPPEIIIIDDESTQDDPASEVKDLPVRVIRNSQRQGVSGARNTGLSHATREFVCFIDADDRIQPGALSKACGVLRRTLGESAICGLVAGFIDSEGQAIFPQGGEGILECPEISHLTYSYFQQGGRIMPNVGRFVFRREFFETVGGFSPNLEQAEDWDLILRWVKQSPILFFPVPMNFYRIHSYNGTVRLRDGRIEADPKTIALGKLVRSSHQVIDSF